MVKQTATAAIIEFLKEKGGWIFGGVIEDTIRDRTGHKASYVSRELRSLAPDYPASKEPPVLVKRKVQVEGKGNLVVQYALNPDVFENEAQMRML